MPLVKITRSRQVTIPKELFEELELQQGDYVEIIRDKDQLILRPKTLVDRTKAQAKAQLEKLLERIWKRNRDVDPKEVERVVAEELQKLRQQRRVKT